MKKIYLLVIVMLQSCAEERIAEKKIETQLKREEIVKQEDIIEAAREHINKSPNLNPEQKKQLISIEEKAMLEISKLKEEINKARMVLVRSAFEPTFNAREVEILKNKILKLERNKIKIGLNAFLEARNIIDPKQIQETKALNKVFMNEYMPMY